MVIDTSVFIEHLRAKDRTKTTLFNLPFDTIIYVSAITVYELYAGATDLSKEKDIHTLLDGTTLLPFTEQTGAKAGEIFRYLRIHGLMIETPDILIGATAILHGLPVKTLNINHFSGIPGLILV